MKLLFSRSGIAAEACHTGEVNLVIRLAVAGCDPHWLFVLSVRLAAAKAPKDPTETNGDDHQQGETHSTLSSKKRIRHACIIKAHESVRKRTKETQHKDHEDHIAETGFNSLSHNNLVRKPVPVLHAMKILDGNAAVDKEWENLKDLPAWRETKVKSKKEVIEQAQKEGRTVQLATLIDLCHLKNSELKQKFQQIQRPRRTTRGCCERRFRLVCSVHRTGIFSISNDGGQRAGLRRTSK